MYLKVVFKRVNNIGHRVMEYRMVESYRAGQTVKQQNILHLGSLPELPIPEQKKELGKRIDELVKEKLSGQSYFFKSSDAVVEKLAEQYANEIISKKRIDTEGHNTFELINTETIRNESVVEIGAEWMSYQALEQLNFKAILANCQFTEEEIALAYTHIISRAVHPSSEYSTARWIRQNSGVCEITNYPLGKITKDKLYAISNKLYEYKDVIEQRLSKKTNELFDLDDKIIIYDLTNTYFEGKMKKSELAQYGRSKEKRSDAKLIVLALVVNESGFVKYSKIFEGNTSDSSSLKKLIEDLSKSTSEQERKPIIVMDAGIATEANLKMLKDKKYDYICVSRTGMKNYVVDTSSVPVIITDKKNQKISLQRVKVEKSTDNYLRVHSESKELKEMSMNQQFKERFETGLKEIQLSLSKPKGIKTVSKVYERLGRLKQKYQSINRYYDIKLTQDEDKEVVKAIEWSEKEMPSQEGQYLLRTTLQAKEEKVQWTIYNTIREIESTFRTLKTDLNLRPVFHKTDKASKAHLHLGILAYWVANTIRYQLKQKGDNSQWKDIVRKMNTQKIVTTRLESINKKIIYIRKFSLPNQDVQQIYNLLNYKSKAFNQRKDVVTPIDTKKNIPHDYQQIIQT